MTARQTLERMARNANIPDLEVQELLREWDNDHATATTLRRYIDPGTTNLNIPLPFVPIVSSVLVEDVADLTISIPSTFQHLMIMGQGRVNGTGGQSAVYTYVQFNEDTGSNYYYDLLYQAGTTHGSNQDLSGTGTLFAYLAADGIGANYNGSSVCFIPHYNSAYYKTVLTFDSVASATSTSVALWQSGWLNTSKIMSLRIYPDPTYGSAKLEAGGLISVYGIL